MKSSNLHEKFEFTNVKSSLLSKLGIEFHFTICGLGPLARGHKREKLSSIKAQHRIRLHDLWPPKATNVNSSLLLKLSIEFDFTICGLGPSARGHKREKLPSITAQHRIRLHDLWPWAET